jgi:hypothetical protein
MTAHNETKAGRAPYPRYFLTPEGRPVSIRRMGAALRAIRANPDADYPGWDWFPTPGHFIIREFRRGLDDRINLRARATSEAS